MPHWDEVYRQKNMAKVTAADVLLENLRLLPPTGKVLDYACGLAGNGFLLANKGYDVTAWDLSSIAVDKINEKAKAEKLMLRAEVKDLEASTIKIQQMFDIIIVSYFLYRKSLRDLSDHLNPGGLLFYQTFSGKQLNGVGPSKAAFRLRRGELLDVYSDMQLLYYREDNSQSDCKPDQVCFVAMK
ncbi:hypothetical protein MNBD_GAMMA09-1082 [hydrothermal vent metagenome]|uniref:Tellurite resistance methyltransferase TehB-like domain-containing protein n=1 Tax=hydrothermal vent metagenome TaxID=652676 RepID=A0A3B0XZW2_9ZZZZ